MRLICSEVEEQMTNLSFPIAISRENWLNFLDLNWVAPKFNFPSNYKRQKPDEESQMNKKVVWLLKTFKYSDLASWADWLKLNRWERVIDSVELLLKRSRPSLKKDHDSREELLFLFNTDKENMSEQKLQREPLKSTGNILGGQAQQIRTKMESVPSETKVRWFVRILKWCALMVKYGIQCSNVL